MSDYELKNVSAPDEVREFPLGTGEIVTIGGGQVALITLQPGWKWSEHVKPVAGTDLCEAPHFQYMISGQVHIRMADGSEFDARAGDVVVVQPRHDAWVVGDEPAVTVDWGGAHVWGKPQG
ncbi:MULTISPECIES: cupin domain-containing protein [Micrococcaceae]|uniref:cupin domain-containing protein n=1 Tax=Micrococcaceae TaxID=1268 RepID=UPI00161945C9|nr:MULTISPECIES: cupin domain-containing protein [Micrococcaceae]MBB5749458.1 quercetin dioxygenase-like cupin family protein [Micrococcus sp. TA1]HRO29608.1 cupin domain-containing protein [Citricoccus sp.]